MSLGQEQGATAIIVAICLLMLMGMVAFAIDGSIAFDDRRGSQNASDIAALAAAWESCNPSATGTSPTAAALAAAADNGYDDDASDVEVNASSDTTRPHAWTVQIVKASGGIFGGATPYAPDEIDVLSQSAAECVDEPLFGGYALFSQGSCPGINEIHTTGSDVTVDGNVHTNSDINTGAHFEVNGTVTYRGDDKISDPDTDAEKYLGEPLDYPIDIEFIDYDPGKTRVLDAEAAGEYYNFGSSTINEAALTGWSSGPLGVLEGGGPGTGIQIVESGIYRTLGGVDLGKVTLAPDVRVTFVARGQIKLTGESDFLGYDPIVGAGPPHMALFSDFRSSGNKCTNDAIVISSNGVSWQGVMFAPNGSARISASSASSIAGSIIAHTINLSGASIDLSFQDDPDRAPNFSVELIR